jgi:hypothetical protein
MNYTFLCEKQGSTFCEQIRAASLRDATLQWHEESASRPGPAGELEANPPAPMAGLRNVWRYTVSHLDGQSFVCHIVATSEVPEHVHRVQLLTEEPDLEAVEVVPGRGLGPVRFGMTIDEVEAALGPIVESTLYDEADRSLQVAYRDFGIHLFFDEVEEGGELLLYTIEVDEDCPCDLYGEPAFPKTREEVYRLLERNLPPDLLDEVEEEEDEENEEIRLQVPPLGVAFFFDLSSEELTQVQWGVLFDETDEEVWPADA